MNIIVGQPKIKKNLTYSDFHIVIITCGEVSAELHHHVSAYHCSVVEPIVLVGIYPRLHVTN